MSTDASQGPSSHPTSRRHDPPKPVAVSILGLVAGLVLITAGASELASGLTGAGSVLVNPFGVPLIVGGAVGIASGGTVAAAGALLLVRPERHLAIGIGMIFSGLLSLLSTSGFVVGLVLGLSAGALAIAWTPVRGPPAPARPGGAEAWPGGRTPFAPYTIAAEDAIGWNPAYWTGDGRGPDAPAARAACPRCGRILESRSARCPSCGGPIP